MTDVSKQEQKYTEEDILVLEGLEAVRKRPGMYIGNTGSKGLHHLVYEIVDNSVDEALAGVCNEIYISIEEDSIITVKDNGRGMPTGIHSKTKVSTVETIFTKLHAGGKFNNTGYKISGGLHGVGASVVNALSEWLEVIVYRDGKIHKQTFSRGNATSKLTFVGNIEGDSAKTGTIVRFKPDLQIFSDINFNYGTLENRIKELAFLNKGLKLILEDCRKGKEQLKTFKYDGGIKEFIKAINKNKTPIHEDIIYCEKETNECCVEIAIQYTDEYSENIYTFANNINTQEGGVHLKSFKDAVLKIINNFARDQGILKDKDGNFTAEDVKEGIVGIVSVKLAQPEFEGQTKTKLGNTEIKSILDGIIQDYLEVYFKEHLDTAKIIVTKALEAKKVREATKKAKEQARKKNKNNTISLEGKLADCSSNKPEECEIFLVEGQSAGGSAKQARDRKFQAILPQKGKVANVEKKREEKIHELEQPQILATALGTGLGSEFDINKLKYHKIVLMNDSDVDGAHIFCLNFTLIYRYMKPLIEKGYVYLANSPLYKNVINKKIYYTYSEQEQSEFLKGKETKNIKIQRYKGLGEMNPEQLWDTTMNPETRKLLQLTVDDFIEMDNTVSLLMGENVDRRREFIQERADLANIDL